MGLPIRNCIDCLTPTDDWYPIFRFGHGDKPYCRDCYLERVPDAAEDIGPLPYGMWPDEGEDSDLSLSA